MEPSYKGDDYNLYSIPILLNGEFYYLHVTYSFTDKNWYILRARSAVSDNGMLDKNLISLVPGDKITTLLYFSRGSNTQDGFQLTEADTFTVTGNTSFYEKNLGDGQFMMLFEMVDMFDESYFSDIVNFTVPGRTSISVHEIIGYKVVRPSLMKQTQSIIT